MVGAEDRLEWKIGQSGGLVEAEGQPERTWSDQSSVTEIQLFTTFYRVIE